MSRREQTTGRTAPTLDDVARAAGVSKTTVSRVINGGEFVAQATLDLVRDAIDRLGYRPNAVARGLVTRRVGTVALIVPESEEHMFDDPFFAQAYRGALEAFADSDMQVVLVGPRPGDAVSAMVRYLHSGKVDGAIIVSQSGRGLAESLALSSPPVAFIGYPGSDSLPYVDIDQVGAARTAARRLLDDGASRIGMIAGTLDVSSGYGCLAGFQQGLAEAGQEAAGVEVGDFSMDSGQLAAERLLARVPDLDALFVANDLMATGALQALMAAGRRVPDDVRIVSMGNSVLAAHSLPPLTTMTNPVAVMAYVAGTIVKALLAGENPAWPVILTSELVVRGSA